MHYIMQHGRTKKDTELIELLLTHMSLNSINNIRTGGDTLRWTGHIIIIIVQFAKRSLHFYVQKVEKQILL